MADNIKENEEEFSQLQQFAMDEPAPTPEEPAQLAQAPTLQEQPKEPAATQAAAPTIQPVTQQAAAPITPITQQQQAAAPAAQQPTPQQLIAQRAAQQAAQRVAQPQMFGQPQQPQPAQPRQTLMTPTTAGQRYRQMLQQNVPQAQAVASGLAQTISTPEAEAQRRLAAAQQEFQQRIAETGLERTPEKTREIIERAAGLGAGQELSPEEFAELERIAATRQGFGEGTRVEDFLSLENYLQAVSQAQEAQEMARMAGTTGARQTLLQQLVRRPEYTSGQALFDALLAGGTAPAAQTIEDVRSRILEQDVLGKAEERTLADIEAARTAEQEEVEAAYQDIQKFLDEGDAGALSGLESSIRQRAESETERAKELNADIGKLLQPKVAGKVNTIIGDTDKEREIIEKLGLTPEQVEGINSISPENRTNLIERLKENITEQTVTSPEELARLNALYKISGLTGRESPRLAVAEGEDLGTLAQQRVKVGKEALEAGRKQTETAIQSAKDVIKDTLSSSIKNYEYGKNMSISSAAKDFYNKMAKDIEKADKDFVINQVKDPLRKANMDLKAELKRLGRIDASEAVRMNASPEDINKQLKDLSSNYFRAKLGGQREGMEIKYTPVGRKAVDVLNELKIDRKTLNNIDSIRKTTQNIANARDNREKIEKEITERVNRELAGRVPGPMLERTRREMISNGIRNKIEAYNSTLSVLRGLEEYAQERANIKLLSDNLGLKV